MYSDVKITMLGRDGSGRTCYMVGMYAYMQLGREGFTLSTLDPSHDLILSRWWKWLVEYKDYKRWPPPTSRTSRWYFKFNYALQPITQVKWLQYRGGAMLDQKTVPDVRHLMDHLISSSCVFLSVSGEHFVERLTPSTIGKVAQNAEINRMTQYMSDLASKVNPTSQQPFPVVIILTKYDLCSELPREKLIATIKDKLFPSLFVPDSNWLTMICPVTLGKELKTTGIIEPHNVEQPIAFAIYAKLREENLNLKAEKRHREAIVEQLDSNFFTRVFKGDEITKQRKLIKELEHQIADVETNIRRLIKLGRLDDAEIFLGGREVRIDSSSNTRIRPHRRKQTVLGDSQLNSFFCF